MRGTWIAGFSVALLHSLHDLLVREQGKRLLGLTEGFLIKVLVSIEPPKSLARRKEAGVHFQLFLELHVFLGNGDLLRVAAALELTHREGGDEEGQGADDAGEDAEKREQGYRGRSRD